MLYSNYNIITHAHCHPSHQPFLIVWLWYAWANCHSVFHFGQCFAHHKILKLVTTIQILQWPTKFHFDWPLCSAIFLVKLYTGLWVSSDVYWILSLLAEIVDHIGFYIFNFPDIQCFLPWMFILYSLLTVVKYRITLIRYALPYHIGLKQIYWMFKFEFNSEFIRK